MKKFILFLLSAVVLVTSFSGCSNKEPSGPITLTVWTHEDPNRTRIEEQFIREFEAANSNIKVERTTQSSSKLIELVQTAFAANQGPDIFNLSIEDEYSYIANGRVAPINYQAAGYKNRADLLNAYDPIFLEPVTVGNNIYGLPLELTNWCIFVNKKVFRSAGLDPERDYPKTWEDMVTVSEKLVIRNG
ncbi:MAG: extracellular solute-binding protein, partial [Treponema sp.]|nr:extracellular solute-binding protein [Treponema sp.]